MKFAVTDDFKKLNPTHERDVNLSQKIVPAYLVWKLQFNVIIFLFL